MKEKVSIYDKISMLTGASAWTTVSNAIDDVPSIKLTDGANGVRNEDIKASCFPSPVALASTFDVESARLLGKAIAKECRYFGTNILLAPSMNIKRSPLCGRNSGYYSEDPVVSGEIAAAFVDGVQSEGVGACVKHFAVYNQETERMTSNAIVDEVALNEIYLKGFEIAVKKSKPAAVMTSYNRSNGVYSSENKKYLTEILREKWGFNGITVSDWGGVDNRVNALKAGLDLEMPISNYGKNKIIDAYEKGLISEEEINLSYDRLVRCAKKYALKKDGYCDFDYSKQVALDVAKKGIVLLKNDEQVLPIDNRYKQVLVVGEGVVKPRVQSGGCDHTNLLWETDFLEELHRELVSTQIVYEQGYALDKEERVDGLFENAILRAKNCDAVIFILSLPESYESEGYDRTNISLPENQVELLERICAINKNTVVILQNGSPIDMRRVNCAKAILETYLLGGIAGRAVAQILSGATCPSGKLAETFPLKVQDTPCYLSFPGVDDSVVYSEGIFVGYRYYLSKEMQVAYPFGFGLSYTQFSIEKIIISSNEKMPSKDLVLSFDITNCGDFDGAEVVQIYIGNLTLGITRPMKELKKFVRCELKKGETKHYEITLNDEDFSCYSTDAKEFVVNNGSYKLYIGCSSIDNRAVFDIEAKGYLRDIKYDNHTRIGEILKTQKGKKIVEEKLLGYVYMAMFGNFNTEIKLGDDIAKEPFFVNVMNNMPLQALCNFSFGEFDDNKLNEVIELLNAK